MSRFILSFLALSLMACFFATADPTPFNDTCQQWSFNGLQLTALCDMKIGSVANSINLDDCYGNYQGTLKPASMGMFTQTCNNLKVDNYLDTSQPKPQPILSADCSQGAGQPTTHNEVSLADVVQNDNGVLQCMGNQGCYTCWADCIQCKDTGGLIPPPYQEGCDCGSTSSSG
ncbi:hypothetical protein PG994_001445 [Apiospora phragmitis]|uniref:Cyanovirin-N domain-containing protein n=1 Tax=Apiospora phragmitis TaxID=2905665 RepID=A0ABR1WTJ5_9PEZI